MRNHLGRWFAFLAVLVLVGLMAAACGSSATHTVTADTEYYRDGPQQARPPEGILPAGTPVRLVRAAGSYSLVETSDGLRVYVASVSLHAIK